MHLIAFRLVTAHTSLPRVISLHFLFFHFTYMRDA